MDTTVDGLLDQRIKLEQPASGYRVSVDTVFLAGAVPAASGQRILDLGCGVGGAMLCLATRVPGLSITGIEIQADLALLGEKNIERNPGGSNLSLRTGDVTALTPNMVGKFDHVMMNPPYHNEMQHDVSDNAQKRTANTEKSGDLQLWIGSAGQALKEGGTLTLIHRADRLREILLYLPPVFGAMEVLALNPKADAPLAKRIIIRARKGASEAITYCTPLILHEATGGYTEAAESILRHLKPVEFVA
jgi:tRNA1(Val) A37 N6-methylase TrmN6